MDVVARLKSTILNDGSLELVCSRNCSGMEKAIAYYVCRPSSTPTTSKKGIKIQLQIQLNKEAKDASEVLASRRRDGGGTVRFNHLHQPCHLPKRSAIPPDMPLDMQPISHISHISPASHYRDGHWNQQFWVVGCICLDSSVCVLGEVLGTRLALSFSYHWSSCTLNNFSRWSPSHRKTHQTETMGL